MTSSREVGAEVNLYRISQDANDGYDTYDSAIVAAESEECARRISPDGYDVWSDAMKCWVAPNGTKRDWLGTWCSHIDNVKVELIGRGLADTQAGVILASFNAG